MLRVLHGVLFNNRLNEGEDYLVSKSIKVTIHIYFSFSLGNNIGVSDLHGLHISSLCGRVGLLCTYETNMVSLL